MPKSLGEYKWEVGTYFTNKKEFTDAIRTYVLSNGRNLKLIKNDKKRVTVKCLGANGKCNWYAYCAYMCLDKSWQLRKVIDDHTCSRDFNVKLITTKWLSEKMEKTIRENPNMKVMDIREKLSRKWNVSISKNMAFRARTMAKYSVEGSFKEQFRRLHDYGHEVLQRNPAHHKDSWTWFLELLIEDLGGVDVASSCTFISDQQKGLLHALQDLLHNVEQRYCVRHLYSNFRKQYPGKDLKQLMWSATTATYPQVLNRFQKKSWLTRYWLPRWSSDQLFEVIHISQFGEQFVVNLDNKDCSCRGWLISGIPCTHAITAMKFLNLNAEEHIAHWFTKSAYEETYNSIIYPINGQHVWEITPYPDILPPKKREMPGRPKKKRRLQPWELKKNDSELRKSGRKKTCDVCKELGHDKKTCPQRHMPSSHVLVDQPTQESTVTHVPADQPT
ncbi:uncharacterized protein LOC106763410 [Vigna radiata var. radiata]|uniref:Uncharacterized protein LOC106763410 n=1 Tax=Vigna radiata var. radiata TaxID=3916 RepID=A0A1S3UAN7_VIGRR|nr:uncharacterized protein LOC106763410 [Vigna radiata var. radiata]